MRLRVVMPVVLLAVCAGAAGESWMVRVESRAKEVGRYLRVVFVGAGCCLAYADAYELERFAEAGGQVTLLDTEPEGKSYVYVMDNGLRAGLGLERFGTVLWEDSEGVVMRTSEAGIRGLNTLPVELAGIGPEPWVFAEPAAAPEPVAVDSSLIWDLVARLNPDSTEAKMRRLIAFRTRYSTTDSCRRAIDWVEDVFKGYGCDTTWQEVFRNDYAPNVIGVKRGTVNPRQVYVITGHVDNTSESPQTFAPGSDDNASGAVAVIEALRAFEGIEFERTVWFVGFSGEEQGLVGSDSFARRCRERGDSIVLAINFDMISYSRHDSITVVHTSLLPQTRQFAEFFLAQADTFSTLKAKDTVVNGAHSDHASFWKYGYLAIRGRYHDMTPKYHTTGDTIGPLYHVNCGTNNIPMQTEVIRALVATVAKLAGAYIPSGVEERRPLPVERLAVGPTIVRGALRLPRDMGLGHDPNCRTIRSCPAPVLLDATGRKVMDLVSGENNVSHLAPGVYFVRSAGGRDTVMKVVVSE